jgi:myo-inositol catabolism protein IolC
MTSPDLTAHGLDRRPLCLLAMDHRASLARDVYGVPEPDAELTDRIRRDKQHIFAGLLEVRRDHHARAHLGVLVDEHYGSEVARRARALGVPLAMPVEASGHPWFTPEYGSLDDGRWLEHLEAFAPQVVKVLVRDNPDLDPDPRRAQLEQLATLGSRLDRVRYRFMIELLVPATADQLRSCGGDPDRYDAELRPGLTEQVITEFHRGGVAPDLWKVEGLETTQAAIDVVAAARHGLDDAAGPADTRLDQARCIVLGRDAPADRLDRWLTTAAGVDGFVGFAIGRSIWEPPLRAHLAGQIGGTDLSHQVAANLTHYLEVYLRARRP